MPTLPEIRSELDADRARYGALSDDLIARDLSSGRVAGVERHSVATADIRAAIDLSEYVALSPENRQWLDLVLGGGAEAQTRIRGTEIKAGLEAIFTSGTTRTNLDRLLATYRGARWEQLGWDRAPTPSEIASARRLPS